MPKNTEKEWYLQWNLSFFWMPNVTCNSHGSGLVVSVLDSRLRWSGFKLWLVSLCCGLKQGAFLSQCLFSPSCVNGRLIIKFQGGEKSLPRDTSELLTVTSCYRNQTFVLVLIQVASIPTCKLWSLGWCKGFFLFRWNMTSWYMLKVFTCKVVVRDDNLSANKMTDNMTHGLITIYPCKW